MSILALLLVVQLISANPAAAASLSASPNSAYPGDVVRVDGSGYLLGFPVNLCWDRVDCDDLGSAYVPVFRLSSFSAEVTIPDATTGTHHIYACQTLTGCSSTSILVLGTAPTTTTTSPTITPTTSPTTTSPPSPTSTDPDTPTTTVATDITPAPTGSEPTQPVVTTTIPGSTGGADPGSSSTTLTEVSASGGVTPSTIQQSAATTTSDPADPPVPAYVPPMLNNDPGPGSLDPSTADEDGLTVAADEETGGGLFSLQSTFGLWAAWFLVVLISGVLISIGVWLSGRRRAASE